MWPPHPQPQPAPQRRDGVSADRSALEQDLRLATVRGEMVVHYQPKGDLRLDRITGAEALLRWNHPRWGTLPPDSFIPLAEESGVIRQLGEWVLEEACRQAVEWQDRCSDFVMGVNLSPRQFQLQQIDEMVLEVLGRTGLDPHRLELEVTESLALEQIDQVTTCLSTLRAMGVRCSLDDFGTGYCGLGYLDQYPVSGIKIDKRFLDAVRTPGGEAPIVRAIIAMARDLQLDVVAEGVETTCQLEFLRDSGCEQIQGFLLSKPVSTLDFEILLLLDQLDDLGQLEGSAHSPHWRRSASS